MEEGRGQVGRWGIVEASMAPRVARASARLFPSMSQWEGIQIILELGVRDEK